MNANTRKIIFISALITTIGGGVISSIWFYEPVRSYFLPAKVQRPWLNIFVHGAFNPGLGLLNIVEVFNDKVKGTNYAQLIKKMRHDPFYYQEQPILARGLLKVTLEDTPPKEGYKYAVHPIASAFKTIMQEITPKQPEHHFYTFGWSGLLSQECRRHEAIRFHNALCEELTKFHAQDIYPQIRLIAHSHGGNVCLNLAAINELTRMKKEGTQPYAGADTLDAKEAQAQMQLLTSKMPHKDEWQSKQAHKQYDYMPDKTLSIIDELILFGTPIQTETMHYFHAPLFAKIFNFYSEQDTFQAMDIISTKRYYCKQRLESLKQEVSPQEPRIIQAKIMIDKDFTTTQPQDKSLWQSLVNSNATTESKDPTHKNLWFLAWNKEFCQLNYPFDPLPMVIFAPLLVKALEEVEEKNDLDLNIECIDTQIHIDVLGHDEHFPMATSTFPMPIIDAIKDNAMRWKPETFTRKNSYHHLQEKE